ncbi:MAG: hypothetical protein P1U74_06560 [Legionellaceae bacterium]|nr:hypothetical protein [Legionellaceae bacterium]
MSISKTESNNKVVLVGDTNLQTLLFASNINTKKKLKKLGDQTLISAIINDERFYVRLKDELKNAHKICIVLSSAKTITDLEYFLNILKDIKPEKCQIKVVVKRESISQTLSSDLQLYCQEHNIEFSESTRYNIDKIMQCLLVLNPEVVCNEAITELKKILIPSSEPEKINNSLQAIIDYLETVRNTRSVTQEQFQSHWEKGAGKQHLQELQWSGSSIYNTVRNIIYSILFCLSTEKHADNFHKRGDENLFFADGVKQKAEVAINLSRCECTEVKLGV